MKTTRGKVVLFGSGETSPSGRKVFNYVLQQLPHKPLLSLLETPAGFELNSNQVIKRVGDFIEHHLQNHEPQIKIISARKRGSDLSPDDPLLVEPILESDLIFLGPGSPTYTVRQLKHSIAWHYCIASNILGATLVLASAATIAISSYSLPVYEIYKVGEEIHWIEGLDFFGMHGMPLIIIPHWNNNEGGKELDTSHCFMGKERFLDLLDLLPKDMTIFGIDEKTALVVDMASGKCEVLGNGAITVINHAGKDLKSPYHLKEINNPYPTDKGIILYRFNPGENFYINWFGNYEPSRVKKVIPKDLWENAITARFNKSSLMIEQETPSIVVKSLVDQREQARQLKNWETADRLRREIKKMGWVVKDTIDGPILEKSD